MTSVDEKQIELIRALTPRERGDKALRLSSEARALSRRAIERAFPQLDARQRDLKFVELHYGRELAARLAKWLEQRGR